MRHTEVHLKDPFGKPWWLMTKEEAEATQDSQTTETTELSPAATAQPISLELKVSLEDNASGSVRMVFEGDGVVLPLKEPVQAPATVSLRPFADEALRQSKAESLYAYFSSPGYATQWVYLQRDGNNVKVQQSDVTLYRKRLTIIRYVVNTTGSRRLVGPDVKEGRCAVPHWGQLPYFGGDWQLWQRSAKKLFGQEPYLEFHRHVTGYGFALPPEDASFEGLTEAPENGPYDSFKNIKATKGLLLYCRVQGNTPKDQCYGKLLVEDVTETPPLGIEVANARR
jgi:hypothetical protein